MPTEEKTLKLIDIYELSRRLGVSISTIERLRASDIDFPVARRIGSRTMRFLEHEVDAYILGLQQIDPFGAPE